MKKVRYVFGAVGMAPALGMIAPAINMAAPGAQAGPGRPAKTVSLDHGGTALVNDTPLADCGSRIARVASKGLLQGYINYSGVCVHSQGATLFKVQTGLTERARFYSGAGRLERTTWQAGRIWSSSGVTRFGSVPNSFAHKVCEALVANGNHNDVKYGPVCENT